MTSISLGFIDLDDVGISISRLDDIQNLIFLGTDF
ncbi:hypothetical protein ZOSMA_184G00130 [Zostera marina]|uniref:Uncharacterized protein n=1 Tax=Zostera marina TaxID=29655 RepID=A0A0K9PSR5_ZOSMR|nr:hypothetical protein ZOSMA_184G00130 [Zostera marina]